MKSTDMIQYLSAQLMLRIWDPELWTWHPNKRVKKQRQLFYKAMGIVQHDRELNNRE